MYAQPNFQVQILEIRLGVRLVRKIKTKETKRNRFAHISEVGRNSDFRPTSDIFNPDSLTTRPVLSLVSSTICIILRSY